LEGKGPAARSSFSLREEKEKSSRLPLFEQRDRTRGGCKAPGLHWHREPHFSRKKEGQGAESNHRERGKKGVSFSSPFYFFLSQRRGGGLPFFEPSRACFFQLKALVGISPMSSFGGEETISPSRMREGENKAGARGGRESRILMAN